MYIRLLILASFLVASSLQAQDYADEQYDEYGEYNDYGDDIYFDDVMGDDYYELPADATPLDRRNFSRTLARSLLSRVSDSYWEKKHALDQNWSNGVIERPERDILLATLDETTKALRGQVRGSDFENMMADELLVFAQNMVLDTDKSFGQIDVGMGPTANTNDPLADALLSCRSYSDTFNHELTGEPMTRTIEGRADGCRYVETMPGGYQLACAWAGVEERAEIATYFRYAEFYADAKVASHTEFRDGQPVTETRYELDGKLWQNPLQDDVEDGICIVEKQ